MPPLVMMYVASRSGQSIETPLALRYYFLQRTRRDFVYIYLENLGSWPHAPRRDPSEGELES